MFRVVKFHIIVEVVMKSFLEIKIKKADFQYKKINIKEFPILLKRKKL